MTENIALQFIIMLTIFTIIQTKRNIFRLGNEFELNNCEMEKDEKKLRIPKYSVFGFDQMMQLNKNFEHSAQADTRSAEGEKVLGGWTRTDIDE